MRALVWMGMLALAACSSGKDDGSNDDTDVGGDDTDVVGTDTDDGGGGGDTDSPAADDGFDGAWSGSLVLTRREVGNFGGNPFDTSYTCAGGTVTVAVDRAGSPDLTYVSHTCTEVDLGTVNLSGDLSVNGDGEPLWSGSEVTVTGTVRSSQLAGGEGISWVGLFVDDDADGVPDRLTVDIPVTTVGGSASPQGGFEVTLTGSLSLTRTAAP